MNWLDVCGPPAVGKSTLLDDLWPPRGIPYDGGGYPDEWLEFLSVAWRLLDEVTDHPSHHKCASMMKRSFQKMATVRRRKDRRTYIQTGFAQRGLGLGWRHKDAEAVAAFYQVMPVSLGVVILKAPLDVIEHRNRMRDKPDRSHMVPGMIRPLEVAEDVLRARGVPVAVLDMTRPIERNREKLAAFAKGAGGTK
jgi:hypothetical protein